MFRGSTQFTVWKVSKQEERRKQPLTTHTVPQIHLLGPQTTLLAEILQRQTETHFLLCFQNKILIKKLVQSYCEQKNM